MRMKLCIFLFLYCCIFDTKAQTTKSFTIKPGEKISAVIPDSTRYTYPAFMSGTVYFRDNRQATAKMNYNSLFEEIMFVNPKGDTLALDNGATIRYIVIKADTFYFDKTFIKQSASFGDIKLGSKELFVIADINSVGAMGQKAPSSVITFKSVLTRSESKDLVMQEILKIRRETHFYFGDRFNNFRIAYKKNMVDFFPGKSKKIKEYFKDNTVNFYDENDLTRTIIFLQTN